MVPGSESATASFPFPEEGDHLALLAIEPSQYVCVVGHEKGVPGKVLAELMGHGKVDTSVNVYSQLIDGAKRAAAEQVGGELKPELFTIVHTGQRATESTLQFLRRIGGLAALGTRCYPLFGSILFTN